MVEFQGADDFFTTVAEGGGKAYRFTDIDGIGPATADKITSIRGVQNPEDVAEMSADELSDKAGISHSRATKAIKGGGGNPNVSKTGGSGGTVSAAGFKQRQGDFMVDFAEKEKAHGRNDTRTRSEEAVKVDDRKRAPVTTNYDKWKQNPSKWDFPGVDTPKQKPDLLTKDVKAGDPETTDFEARDEDIRERKEMSYPRKVKDGRVLQLDGNRVPAFQVNQEVPDIAGVAPGLSKTDFEEEEPEPGPDVMGHEPSSQRLPETARQNLASGESADISFVQAEQSRRGQQPESVGDSISLTLEEKAKPPLNPVTELPGVGPKTADRLQRKYGITTIRDYYQDEQVAREELSQQYRAKARAVAADSVGVDIPGV